MREQKRKCFGDKSLPHSRHHRVVAWDFASARCALTQMAEQNFSRLGGRSAPHRAHRVTPLRRLAGAFGPIAFVMARSTARSTHAGPQCAGAYLRGGIGLPQPRQWLMVRSPAKAGAELPQATQPQRANLRRKSALPSLRYRWCNLSPRSNV